MQKLYQRINIIYNYTKLIEFQKLSKLYHKYFRNELLYRSNTFISISFILQILQIKKKYIIHFLNDYTCMYYIYILYNKIQIFFILYKFVVYIKKQYNFEIRIFYYDRETNLVKNDVIE